MTQFSNIRTILMGTPEFAERIFRKFLGAKLLNFDIVAVITAPDKPVGRKQELTPSPVKKWALKNNLNILQPEKIGNPEWNLRIKQLNPDLIITAAYGQMIPKEILDIVDPRLGRAKFGVLNIHPSLLPKYRGASPIHAAILNGDKTSGVTIIKMDEKMDHGPIISNFQFPIFNKPTYEKLSEKLADAGAELLVKTLPGYVNRKIKPEPQDHSKAIFCKIIKKQDGKIDWNKSAEEIERQIRAFHEWPNAFASLKLKDKSQKLKVLGAEVLKENSNKKTSEVFLDNDKNLCVQTGSGVLILKQVQLEGKKPMTAKDFLNGHPEIIGTILK